MERTLEYLEECGVFFVAAGGERPCVCPLASACWYDGALYILVRRESPLYGALKKDAAVSIAAVHPDKSWLSVTGRLVEDARPEAAAAMQARAKDTLSAVYDGGGEGAVFRLEGGRAVVREIIGRTQEWTIG